MGTGYTRADTANNIADGNIINASDLDSEYDAIQSAFNASTGHTHDGTAGEGAPIETIGPSQDVVATASVLRPKTDNTVDLGTTSLEYKDLFLDGTAHIDTLDVDENASITGTLGVTGTTTLGTANITTGTITTADINGGNIDGTIIGASSAAAITGTTITGTSFVTSGNMTFGDNDKAVFGAGSDLQIYHNGSNSYISEGGTGNLYIEADNQLILRSASGELYGKFERDSAVTLYYDNAAKLATTSTGVDVTGNATFADNGKAIFGAGSDLQIYFNGADGVINESIAGNLLIQGDNIYLQNSTASSSYLRGVSGGAVDLRYAGSPKLATTSTGVDITGTLTSDGLTVDNGVSSSIRIAGNGNNALNTQYGTLEFYNNDASTAGPNIAASIKVLSAQSTGSGANMVLGTTTGSEAEGTPALNRLMVGSNGDISFYEDTGTTAKFFWDASAESLGIGTSSPDTAINIGFSGADQSNALRIEGSNGSSERYALDIEADGENAKTNFKIGVGGGAPTTRMTIDSSGNVGIGTSSPSELIELSSASDPRIRINNSADTLSANTIIGGLEFYTNDASAGGTGIGASIDAYAQSNFGSNQQGLYLTFSTRDSGSGASNTERMRIDSSGNLLVGTTDSLIWNESATDNSKEGVVIEPKSLQISRYQDTQALFNRQGNAGKNILFAQDGVEVGSIRSISADSIGIGNGVAGLRFVSGTNRIQPVNMTNGLNSDALTDLGDTNKRFQDLYLSGGVYLGGVTSSNKLEDYEVGQWDVVISGETSGSVDTGINGNYVKVGDFVHAAVYMNANLDLTSISGVVNISLPFSAVNWTGGGNIVYASSFLAGSAETDTFIGLRPLGARVRMVKGSSTTWLQDSDIEKASGNKTFMMQATFEV